MSTPTSYAPQFTSGDLDPILNKFMNYHVLQNNIKRCKWGKKSTILFSLYRKFESGRKGKIQKHGKRLQIIHSHRD